MTRTRLYLVRHGEQGGAGLSPTGRDQAERLGRRLSSVPFAAVHYSAVTRAVETADIVTRHLPPVPAHACDHVLDRTPVPLAADRGQYPEHLLPFLDSVPAEERDADAVALQATVGHFGVVGDEDRTELLITHNFVIGWFVRHVMDAPAWRWAGLNQDNCAITVVQFASGRPPSLIAYNDTGHL